MKVLIAQLTVGMKIRLKAAAKPQSQPEAAHTQTTPAPKLIYTNTYLTVTICFFHGKGNKDEIRYSNPFVRVPAKYGKNMMNLLLEQAWNLRPCCSRDKTLLFRETSICSGHLDVRNFVNTTC
jgi:hypothetical protein